MTCAHRERLASRISDLRATPGFTVEVAEVGPPAPAHVIDSVLAECGGRLPAGVSEFYAQADGFRMEWEYAQPEAEGSATDSGSVNLLPIEEVFADWKGAVWFDDFGGGDRFRAVKPFDLYVPEACAAFLREPGSAPLDTVCFHYIGEHLAELPLTFPEYIDEALNTCGYLGWHTALLSHHAGRRDPAPELARMREIIPGFSDRRFRPPQP